MGIHRIQLRFFPKFQFLLGLHVQMHEIISMENNEAYDGVDIELGIGILVFSVTLAKKKGAS